MNERIKKNQLSANHFVGSDEDDDKPQRRLDRSRHTIALILRLVGQLDATRRPLSRLKEGGRAWKAARSKAMRIRVKIAREFRQLALVPAQVDALARAVLDADAKIKRHSRSIHELNEKMKSFRDAALRREVRRKIEQLRSDIRVLEQDMGGDRRALADVAMSIHRGMRQAKKAKSELVEANLRLVVSNAKKYTNAASSSSTSSRRGPSD